MPGRSARKRDPLHSERIVSAAATLQLALPIAAAKGVTRIADITGLDRIGVPVHSAIVPASQDGISVYNGKGLTAEDSRASAVMEAIERQTALGATVPVIEERYANLKRSGRNVADPQEFNHKLRDQYSEQQRYAWMEGRDLFTDEPVLVPAGLAGYGPRFMGDMSPYESNSSNGLASGNCYDEAVCHALCELVERDAWTLADMHSRWIPRARREAMLGRELGAFDVDDLDVCPRIDLTDADPLICDLAERYYRAGLAPVVRDITSDFGIPSVLACVADDSAPGFPQAHAGAGTHPNASIAVIRALTELAQSRAVDIQGVREDLAPADATVAPEQRQMQRPAKIEAQRWMLHPDGVRRPLHAMPSLEQDDIAADIRFILSRLAGRGIGQAIVVDFSEAGSPFSVVRMLVPGLEFWSLDQGKLGPRALQFWREHV